MNEEAFKKIDNIKDIEDKVNGKSGSKDGAKSAYKFTGWDPPLEDIAKTGPKDGEDTVNITA